MSGFPAIARWIVMDETPSRPARSLIVRGFGGCSTRLSVPGKRSLENGNVAGIDPVIDNVNAIDITRPLPPRQGNS
jgi:hypothetical protein